MELTGNMKNVNHSSLPSFLIQDFETQMQFCKGGLNGERGGGAGVDLSLTQPSGKAEWW